MLKEKRIIAVFSGNRAEYGLQYPILKAIQKHPDLDYKLIISGAHLDDDYGKTKSEIRQDGFEIFAEVSLDMSSKESTVTPHAIASGIIGISTILQKLQPDIFVVYADRFEGFAAVISSTQMSIPTAHIEGGDITEGGALDDSVRHAMTKLSHLHYTTNEQASNRILAMGEEKWRVKTVGFPAIDLIKNSRFANPKELLEKFGIKPEYPVVIFTQHSVTTEYAEANEQLMPSMKALIRLAEEGVQIILTYPNNDVGGNEISKGIEKLLMQKHDNIQLHKSIGRYYYHGVLALARMNDWRIVCVGNSSSGIKETPAFGCPTVNIGSRQQGRLRGDNVMDADYNEHTIYSSIRRCLYNDEFRGICSKTINPYGGGKAGQQIAESLALVNLSPKIILRKKMLITAANKEGRFC